MPKILVVDDEPAIAELLKYNLEQNDFAVAVATDGQQALDMIESDTFDLMLLDLMLPKIDGMQLTKQLRQDDNQLPIIMVTAMSSQMDKIGGFDLGADDYVTKPFDIQEIIVRIKAILRRQPATKSNRGLQLERANFQVLRDGKPISLTKTQYKLFDYLYTHANQTLTRQQIMDYLWGKTSDSTTLDSRAIDIQISHLRDKLEVDPKHPQYLQTIRGFGYRLAI